MSKKKAFITGVSGQDGSYLAEYLLEQDYEVYGMIRRHSVAESQEVRIDHLVSKGLINTDYGDLLDAPSLYKLLALIKPDEIYNYENDQLQGYSETNVYMGGCSKEKGNFKDGKRDGLRTIYWETGQLAYQGMYRRGKEEGVHERFYPNGQLERRGRYSIGSRHGRWDWFERDGRPLESRIYDYGEMICC